MVSVVTPVTGGYGLTSVGVRGDRGVFSFIRRRYSSSDSPGCRGYSIPTRSFQFCNVSLVSGEYVAKSMKVPNGLARLSPSHIASNTPRDAVVPLLKRSSIYAVGAALAARVAISASDKTRPAPTSIVVC